MEHEVRLVCREGTLERLTADLAVHEIDMVLSDAAVSPSLNVRAYSHHLGSPPLMDASHDRRALRRVSADAGWRADAVTDGGHGDSPRHRSMAGRLDFPPS